MPTNNTTTATAAATITGRDGYIVLKALIYAVARIQSLPADKQEYGDMLDMCELARDFGRKSPLMAMTLWDVERHVGREVDLWPADGGNHPTGRYSADDLAFRDHVRNQLQVAKDQVSEWNASPEAAALTEEISQAAKPTKAVSSGDLDCKGIAYAALATINKYKGGA